MKITHTLLWVGVTGSWNDLSNTGDPDPNSPYYPQGYIVEYGGMPGDPIIQISASTTIVIPRIEIHFQIQFVIQGMLRYKLLPQMAMRIGILQ
jgi:hypothetical protein